MSTRVAITWGSCSDLNHASYPNVGSGTWVVNRFRRLAWKAWSRSADAHLDGEVPLCRPRFGSRLHQPTQFPCPLADRPAGVAARRLARARTVAVVRPRAVHRHGVIDGVDEHRHRIACPRPPSRARPYDRDGARYGGCGRPGRGDCRRDRRPDHSLAAPLGQPVTLLDLQQQTLGMTVEFGSVHTLDRRKARLVLASQLHPRGVFKHIRSLGQVIDEEMARRIARRLVVSQPILEAIP